MKLKKGGMYKLRNGDTVGPLQYNKNGTYDGPSYKWFFNNLTWLSGGFYIGWSKEDGSSHEMDIVSELSDNEPMKKTKKRQKRQPRRVQYIRVELFNPGEPKDNIMSSVYYSDKKMTNASRDDGPAEIWYRPDGTIVDEGYWFNNVWFNSKQKWEDAKNEWYDIEEEKEVSHPCAGKTVEIDGVKYVLSPA